MSRSAGSTRARSPASWASAPSSRSCPRRRAWSASASSPTTASRRWRTWSTSATRSWSRCSRSTSADGSTSRASRRSPTWPTSRPRPPARARAGRPDLVTQPTLPLRVAVSGARGKVGREIVAALRADPAFECAAEIDVGDDLAAALRSSGARVLVDFTTPESGLANALTAASLGVAPVIGTTGLGAEGVQRVRAACESAGIGGCRLPPSQPRTEPLAGTRGGELGGAAIHALRLSGVVADQTVILGAASQTLALEHRTTSRAGYVPGVLLAVRAVSDRAQFFDSLEEVL